jgi:hypothetical protein
MKLSPLETDLLGDLALDNHGLWEVFEFVRLHNSSAPSDAVMQIGLALLDAWVLRGWLAFRTESGTPLDAAAVMASVHQAPNIAMQPSAGAPWLGLSQSAFETVTWLSR